MTLRTFNFDEVQHKKPTSSYTVGRFFVGKINIIAILIIRHVDTIKYA